MNSVSAEGRVVIAAADGAVPHLRLALTNGACRPSRLADLLSICARRRRFLLG
jgi:hypothetical protein